MEGFQRKYLRGLAHSLKPVVQIGHSGLTEAVIAAADAALAHSELIKVKMNKPDDKQQTAQDLAQGCHAELCGLVGHTAILYRQDPEAPKIQLPTRGTDTGADDE